MRKYDDLRDYLKNTKGEKYDFTFKDIAEIVGFTLPSSAYEYSAFWSNASQNSFSRAWLEAGYIQKRLNLSEQTVSFVQNEPRAEEYLLKAQQKKKKGLAEVSEQKECRKKILPPISDDCDMLIEKADIYFDKIRKDPNARYLSWEHCYSYFQKNHIDPNDETLDWLCLHLAWYLASWGMLRGGAFLLQKDYRIHLPIVKLLTSAPYRKLYGLTITELCEEAILKQIKSLSAEIVKIYRNNTKIDALDSGSTSSPILITKILLGTIGCTPAYDRYFISGLRSFDVKQTNYNSNSLLRLAQFYNQNSDKFEKFRKEISQGRIEYPPMKIIDMCFWQVGYELDKYK